VGSFKYEDPYNDVPFPAAQITPDLWMTAVATEARWRSYDEGKSFYLTDHQMSPAMWLSPEAKQTAESRRLLELLNLQPEPLRGVWIFKSNSTVSGPESSSRPHSPRDQLKTRIRSFYGVMNLLAYGVQVPSRDAERCLTFSPDRFTDTVHEGRFEDLRKYFIVKSQATRPETAFIAVCYRDNWFYIDDADLTSKRIFNAFCDLFHLQVAPSGEDSGRVLTLPVG